MMRIITLIVLLSIALAQTQVTITGFSPKNHTAVDGNSIPITVTFSNEVKLGDGSFVLTNSLGDKKMISTNSTMVVLGEKNVTISNTEKYYYGSTVSLYFMNSTVVDMDGNVVELKEGAYSFTINKKDNGPMFIGIGIGMGIMLVLIFIAYFILKCLVKRKEAREKILPETAADTVKA